MFKKNNIYQYGLIAAGIIFIGIGLISLFYVNISIKVKLDGVIEPGKVDIITPNMNIGDTLNIYISGSKFDLNITGPEKNNIAFMNSVSNVNNTYQAKIAGKHVIQITNVGNTTVLVEGDTYTKGNQSFYIGQIMLIITGIVILGLGIRTIKNR